MLLFPYTMQLYSFFPGDYGEEVTPVSIPNTEVKGLSGEGTAGFARGRVARCRDFFPKEPVLKKTGSFLFVRIKR